MRALILPDATTFAREHAMIARLQVGLADEGVRVVQGVPASAAGTEAASLLAGGVYALSVRHQDRGLPLMEGLRAEALARDVEALARGESAERALDAVLALGDGAWTSALRVGRRLGAAVVLSVEGRGQVERAGAVWRRAGRSGNGQEGVRPLFVTPGDHLADALATGVPRSRVVVAPWGVYPTRAAHAPVDRGRSLSVVVLLSGRDAEAARGALLGLERAAETTPDLHVIVDADAARRLDLWRWTAAKPSIRGRLTLTSNLDGRHDLVTEADMLLVPESLGQARGLVLQAMADGMLVAAREDALVDWLIPGVTCCVLEDARAETVARRVLALADDPRAGGVLRASAKEWVQVHRPASAYVRGVLAALTSATDSGVPAKLTQT